MEDMLVFLIQRSNKSEVFWICKKEKRKKKKRERESKRDKKRKEGRKDRV